MFGVGSCRFWSASCSLLEFGLRLEKDAAFNDAGPDTLFGSDARGYTDYPMLAAVAAEWVTYFRASDIDASWAA